MTTHKINESTGKETLNPAKEGLINTLLDKLTEKMDRDVTLEEFKIWLDERHFSNLYDIWVDHKYPSDLFPMIALVGDCVGKHLLATCVLTTGIDMSSKRVCKYKIGGRYPVSIYPNEGCAVRDQVMAVESGYVFKVCMVEDQQEMKYEGWMVFDTVSYIYTRCDSVSEVAEVVGVPYYDIRDDVLDIRETGLGSKIGIYVVGLSTRAKACC